MADNKHKLSLIKLYRILAFTTIIAIALIVSGITLFCIPTEMVNEDIQEDRQEVVDYTHCVPVAEKYESCEQNFYDINKNKDFCKCFVDHNFTDLYGELKVYSQLEISNQEFLSSENSSIKTFADLVSKSSRHCDPYITSGSTDNCEAIPDEIFKDEFLAIGNDVRKFSKSNKWGPAGDNSVNGFHNAITILLHDTSKTNETLPILNGSYTIYITFYQNVNVWRKALIFSEVKKIKIEVRSNVIEIVAVVLGLVLLGVSIAMFALRNRILAIGNNTLNTFGAEENNVTMVTEDVNSSNTRKPRATSISTDKLLPVQLHTTTSIELESKNDTPDDDTKSKLTISQDIES